MSTTTLKLGFTCAQLGSNGFPIDTEKIALITKWLQNSDLPKFADEQIVQFLSSCDENVEFTKTTIKAYVRIKRDSEDIFNNRRCAAKDVQKAFTAGSLCVLPRNITENYVVIMYSPKNSDYWSWDLKHAVKILFMAIECAIYDYPAKELIILADCQNIGMGHLLKLRPRPLTVIFNYMQMALPVKLKHMHILNSTSILNRLLKIIAPLMHKELLAKITFYPKNLNWDEFYEQQMPRRILCKDYGGDLSAFSELEEQTKRKFAQIEDYFEQEEKLLQNSAVIRNV